MKRLILTACLLALTAASADAGPLRRLFGRGWCGGCQPTAAPVQYPQAAPVTMPQTGTVQLVRHSTSYEPPAVTGGVQYQPIRLTSPVPVCPTCR
jgi:hypothetical protein